MTFPAELGLREKILTAIVCVVITLVLLVAYGTFGAKGPLGYLMVAFLAAIFVGALGLRPLGYTLGPGELVVERPFLDWTLRYVDIRAVRAPTEYPSLFVVGVFRAEGFFGSYGFYWTRAWGLFRVFVTDSKKLVEIVREDGSRVIVSPNDPSGFRDALIAHARVSGAEIAFGT